MPYVDSTVFVQFIKPTCCGVTGFIGETWDPPARPPQPETKYQGCAQYF